VDLYSAFIVVPHTQDAQVRIRQCYLQSVYLTCGKKMTGSELSLPHGINKKLKCETKNKMMNVIGSPVGKRNLRWEGFVEMVGFEPGVKE